MAEAAKTGKEVTRADRLVYGVFFVSGMAALLYQLAWQRSLFTIYGTNSESITAIVAAFMLGLGLGSIVGGRISHHTKWSRVKVFAVVELITGLYGFISLPLLGMVGEATAGVNVGTAMALSFTLVVLPTLLMGATLPILVQHLVEQDHPVGEAVGELYYVNTLGSASVCVLATLFLFGTLGLSGSVYLAGTLNLVIAAVIWAVFGRLDGSDEAKQ